MAHRGRVTLLAACIVTPVCLCFEPAHSAPTATAEPGGDAVTVDGRLDDGPWRAATWYGGFTRAEPAEAPLTPAPVGTRFAVLSGDRGLVVGIECDEAQIGSLRAQATEHDGLVFGDDCVEIFLNATGEGRYYQHFVINTLGIWYDDDSADYGLVHSRLWDCDIEAAAHADVGASKWTVEVRIPFAALPSRGTPGEAWLLNIARERYAGGAQELSTWSPLSGNFHQPRLFGRLLGVSMQPQRYAIAVSAPRVEVEATGDGTRVAALCEVTNETGASARLRASSKRLAEPGALVEGDVATLASGETAAVRFPALPARAGEGEVLAVLEVREADSGDLLRSTVARLSTAYEPITVRLLMPCYRNTIFASETIEALRFRVGLSADIAERAEMLRFRLVDGKGAPIAEGEAAVTGPATEAELPCPDLPLGDSTLETVAEADGARVAEIRTPVHKLPPPSAGTEVRVDANGNILVNGRPFVGIGWYGEVPVEDPRADVVALQNLQTPHVPTLPDVSGITGPFAEHGIYSIVSVEPGRIYYSLSLWRGDDGGVRDEWSRLDEPSDVLRGYVTQLIEAVRAEPGLLGYYIADEPEINNVRPAYLEAYYRLLTELDPYHPVVVTNDTLDGIITHGYRCADILSPDPYSPEPDYVPNFMKRCQEVMGPGQALALTPWHSSTQAHFTNEYGTAPPYSFVTMRGQYLVSLAYGARAWTAYTSPFFMPEVVHRYGLPHMWREVRFLEPAMAAPAPAEPLAIQADAEVAGWIREAGGRLYLVVVNHKPGEREVTVGHPLLRDASELIVVAEGRRVAVTDGVLTDHFREGDARIYTTDPAGEALPSLADTEAEVARQAAAAVKPGNLLHVSRGTRVAASEGYYAPWFNQYYYYVANGIVDDLGWYASHVPEGQPAWVELTLPQPERVGRVVLYTPNLSDYDLTLREPGGGVNRAQVRGNEAMVIEHALDPPVDCLKLRLTALAVRAGATPTKPLVSEVEAYTDPGGAPPITTTYDPAPETDLETHLPAAGAVKPNALWVEDFDSFECAESYNWDGHDTKWVLKPADFRVEPTGDGRVVCRSTAEPGYSAMTRIFPHDGAHRFLQVKLDDIRGDGYRFTTVAYGSSSGAPGYRTAVNTARPGIYTVDTHYVHESFRSGEAKEAFVGVFCAGAGKAADGAVTPGTAFTYDWLRLVARPVDGLAVTMADGSPLSDRLAPGDELEFAVVLAEPAADVTVDVLCGAAYAPLPLNGEAHVQLLRVGARDGREWGARLRLADGTGSFDTAAAGYPAVFRARVVGGGIQETYASAAVTFGPR